MLLVIHAGRFDFLACLSPLSILCLTAVVGGLVGGLVTSRLLRAARAEGGANR